MRGLNSVTQLTQNPGLTRRGFLSLGVALGATLIGCGESDPTPPITIPTNPPTTNPPTSMPPQDVCPQPGPVTTYGVDAKNSLSLESYYVSGLQSDGSRVFAVANNPNYIAIFDPNTRPLQMQARIDIVDPSGRNETVNFLRLYPSKDRAVLIGENGFYDFSVDAPPPQNFIPFPSGKNLGGGAIFVGAQLFVAVANGSIDRQTQTVNFGQGSILVYNYGPNGVEQNPVDEIPVSGLNPTGLNYRKQSNELVVANSGNFPTEANPKGGQGAMLELISLANYQSRAYTLENHLEGLTAQVFGDIAMTCDGSTAILGSAAYQAQDGRILFVDLVTGGIVLHQLLGTTFHTGIQIADERVVLVSDYNDKSINQLDLQTRKEITEKALPLASNAGPSTLVGRDLYQAIVQGVVGVYPV